MRTGWGFSGGCQTVMAQWIALSRRGSTVEGQAKGPVAPPPKFTAQRQPSPNMLAAAAEAHWSSRVGLLHPDLFPPPPQPCAVR